MIDTYKLKGLRAKLVKAIRDKGIQDENVLKAIGKVPRHCFVESAFAEQSYDDRPLPIGANQTISQPYTVARQSELLEVKPGMKVLEIGTGSGYQAAVLLEMGARLFSIERIRPLYNSAQRILSDLGYKPRLKWGDGSPGWPVYAPFDRIVVTAASPSIPEALKKQMAVGGIMVIPVGDLEVQTMMKVERISLDEYRQHKLKAFQFVPMIGRHGWKEEQL